MQATAARAAIRLAWITLPRPPETRAVWWNGRTLRATGDEADGDVLIGYFNQSCTLQDFTAQALDTMRWEIPSVVTTITQSEARA